MDRNLTERLKKLSKELAETQNRITFHGDEYTDQELESLNEHIDDIQDEIWEVEDQIRDEADYEYGEQSAKGWN